MCARFKVIVPHRIEAESMSQSSLLKIGEFSQLSQVSVKTLRYYDDLGLLRPIYIDPSTNYRYYSVEQLSRVHRIMALKELGLSLDQISLLIDENLTLEQIRGMLRLKQAEIHQQIREAERVLEKVEFRLRMLEAEANFPELDVVIKRIEPLRVLSLFVQAHHSQKTVAQAIRKAINGGLIQYTGVLIDVFHGETILPLESPQLEANQHEIMIGVKASQEAIRLDNIGTFSVREENAIETAATMILTGKKRSEHFEKVALLRRWAVAHGYKPLPLVRYLHHQGILQTDNPDERVFEAQLAVDIAR